MRELAPRAGRLFAGLLALAVFAGCPVPVAHTDTMSSPIAGRLERADGTPIADARVRVASDSARGAECRIATFDARTDSTGRFAFPATQRHYDRTWIVPGLDLAVPQYDVCVGLGDTMRVAYHGQVMYRAAGAADSVTCVAWDWHDRPRVSCLGYAERSVVSGGEWRARGNPSLRGFYRVLIARDPDAPPSRWPHERPPHVHLQWLRATSSSAAPARYEVLRTVELPVDEAIYALGGTTIEPLADGWIVRIRGYDRGFLNDFSSTEMVFQIDAPGEINLMRSPHR